MFIIYQHIRSRRSLVRLTDSPQDKLPLSCIALGHPLFKQLQFMIKLSNPDFFHILSGDFLISFRSPQPIIRYKIFNKCFSFFSEKHFWGLGSGVTYAFEFTRKSFANNDKQYQKLIQKNTKQVIISTRVRILVAAQNTLVL